MRLMGGLASGEADVEEIDMLLDVSTQVEGHAIRALGNAAPWPIQGLIRHFRDDVEDRIEDARTGRTCAMAAGTGSGSVRRFHGQGGLKSLLLFEMTSTRAPKPEQLEH